MHSKGPNEIITGQKLQFSHVLEQFMPVGLLEPLLFQACFRMARSLLKIIERKWGGGERVIIYVCINPLISYMFLALRTWCLDVHVKNSLLIQFAQLNPTSACPPVQPRIQPLFPKLGDARLSILPAFDLYTGFTKQVIMLIGLCGG